MVRPIQQAVQTAPGANVDRWFERMLPLLLRIIYAGWIGSRAQSVRYLRDHAEAEGRLVDPVPALWTPERVVTSLRVTGPVAFKQHVETFRSLPPNVNVEGAKRAMVTRMIGASQRQAMAGGRDTIARTVRASDAIVGWRRVTDANPCAFCAMLASRGAIYTATTVRFAAHDGDECTFAPLYEHEDEPADVDDLYQRWLTVTKGHSGKAAIREWRHWWDTQRQEASGG